ncbi:diacylglycerol kinase family protein [Azospirillum sp. TSH64]|uniref:diacylglycerol/lipid kinase family protein n=1 Tax=Azospirillum sp. TSH64 TaxID=652740 RepID=UPI000D60D098|nr:diacylglycerol kinase family protein [Azospirillum sp. TSH64]PWC78155.1 lipid kinase [Azospirillum sp. TSH64]PWC81575.1 lipid kinase [Azospirillum sp. TSH64]
MTPTVASPAPDAWLRPDAKPRRVLVIHNPVAGGRRALRLYATIEELAQRHGANVTVWATSKPGDAEAMAAAVKSGRYDVIAVAGGDGTISEAINGLAACAAPVGIPLGIIPLGTANVLAHELGLPFDPSGTAALLATGGGRPIHLGVVNGRYFSMMAGVGLDARVVDGVSTRFKRVVGKAAYATSTLVQLCGRTDHVYHVKVNEESWEVASVVVANGRFYGGRFVCAPQASLAVPGLHVCLFRRPGQWNAVRYMCSIAMGRLHRLPDYRVIPAGTVSIEGPAGEPVQADGDIVARLPVQIASAARPLPVLAPASLTLGGPASRASCRHRL